MMSRKNWEKPGVDNNGRIVIRLTVEEHREAWFAGLKRYYENIDKLDTPDYRNDRNETDLIAQSVAVLCELAVAKYLDKMETFWERVVWKAEDHYKYRDSADVGDNIEVRRVRKITNSPTVNIKDTNVETKNKDRPERYLVAAYADPDTDYFNIKLLGWISCNEAWEKGGMPSWADPSNTRKREIRQSEMSLFNPNLRPNFS